MSSHHFVKEGQEPAILIIDPIAHELIEPLLEWAPLVMVYDHSLDRVLDSGIKIDVVIAINRKAEDLIDILKDQMPVKIVSCLPGENPLEKSIQFLKESQQAALNIICENPISIMQAIDQHNLSMNVSVLTASIRWSLIASGDYKKWLPKNTKLQIKGGEDVKIRFNTEGETDAEEEVIDVIQDGLVHIRAQSRFWIGES
jgi:hypothetical protein